MPSDFEREYKNYIESDMPDLWGRIEAGIEADAPIAAQTADEKTDNKKIIRWGVFAKRAGQIAAAIALVFVAYALVQFMTKGGMRASESTAPMADAAAEAPAMEAEAPAEAEAEAVAEAADEYYDPEGAAEEAAPADNAMEAEAPVSLGTDSGQYKSSDKTASLKQDTREAEGVEADTDSVEDTVGRRLSLKIGNKVIDVEWEDNAAVSELTELASDGDLTIEMSGYGDFEQVGSIGQSLPTDDSRITTSPGDIMLYSGDQIVIFYGSNTWSYTRLGRITGLSDEELKDILSGDDVTVTLTSGR